MLATMRQRKLTLRMFSQAAVNSYTEQGSTWPVAPMCLSIGSPTRPSVTPALCEGLCGLLFSTVSLIVAYCTQIARTKLSPLLDTVEESCGITPVNWSANSNYSN